MYFTKVWFHQVIFILLSGCIFLYLDLHVAVKVLVLIQAYIASYLISMWMIKFIYICFRMRVSSENRCVLITGCDSGFGNETAIQLNKLGFKVFATCLDPNGEGALHLMNMADDPKKMIVIGMDVTKEKQIEVAYETVRDSMKQSESLFGLVNNAGICIAGEFEFGPDLSDCDKILSVNLMGMIKVTRQFLPLIRQSKGRIVNVESFAGLVPIPLTMFYGVSKIAAAGFSDNLRIGMYRFGVNVVSINPYFYRTPITNARMLINQYESNFKSSSEEVRKAYGATFLKKGKVGISISNIATKSNAVPNTIVSALTAYEPDPRYIVAPTIMQPILRLGLWLPRETGEAIYQFGSWIFGMHKVYPE